MLYFVVVWTFLLFICFGSGITLLGLLKADCFESRGDRLIVAIWLGITMLSVVFLSISLFVPLSLSITLPIALLLAGVPWLFPQLRSEIVTLFSRPAIAFWFILQFGVALLTTREVTWYDSGLYHVGKIRWLAEYGTVPGLYLIQDRFGWNSSWFAFSAVLNPTFVDYRATAVANGFIVAIVFLHFFLSITRIVKGDGRIADWFVTIAYFILLPVLLDKNLPLTNQQANVVFFSNQARNLIAKLVISPSPDIPVILLIIITAWTMLIISERQSLFPSVSPLDVRTIPLLLAAGATTIKLTAAGLILIALPFYCFSKRFWWQRIFWGILLNLILLAPMFASGIITSACPLFPSLFMCVKLPWSTYPAHLNDLGIWWKAHSLLGYPSQDKNFWWWLLSEWFRKNNLNKIILFCSILALILLIWLVIYKRRQLAGVFWVLILGIVGISFILSQAPDTRYGLGYFLLIPCSTIGAFCHFVTANSQEINLKEELSAFMPTKWLSSAYLLPWFSLALIGVLSFQGIRESRFLLPPPLPEIKVFRDRVNKIEYFQPLPPDICWGTKLPCSHGFLNHSVRLWKPKQGIRGGFTGSRPETDWQRKR